MLLSRTVVEILAFGLMALLAAGGVTGQDYPTKPIRIVTSAVGGGSDFIAREISQGLSGLLGQQVVVDNRGSGFLAVDVVHKAPPDGYTLLVAGGSFWITPLLRKVDYDVKDFSPISLLVREVNVLAVHPSLPIKSVKELIVLAKARPGELNYSTGAIGGTPHLASELFMSMAGIKMVHVAYKGSAPAVAALIGGEVQLIVMDAALVMTHVKSGRLKAIAVTSAEPSALVPGLPTVASSGLPGYEMIGMTGLLAPGKPAVAIINRLNQDVVRVINRAEVKERFLKAGVEMVGGPPKQFADAIESDVRVFSKVIKDAGLRTE